MVHLCSRTGEQECAQSRDSHAEVLRELGGFERGGVRLHDEQVRQRVESGEPVGSLVRLRQSAEHDHGDEKAHEEHVGEPVDGEVIRRLELDGEPRVLDVSKVHHNHIVKLHDQMRADNLLGDGFGILNPVSYRCHLFAITKRLGENQNRGDGDRDARQPLADGDAAGARRLRTVARHHRRSRERTNQMNDRESGLHRNRLRLRDPQSGEARRQETGADALRHHFRNRRRFQTVEHLHRRFIHYVRRASVEKIASPLLERHRHPAVLFESRRRRDAMRCNAMQCNSIRAFDSIRFASRTRKLRDEAQPVRDARGGGKLKRPLDADHRDRHRGPRLRARGDDDATRATHACDMRHARDVLDRGPRVPRARP